MTPAAGARALLVVASALGCGTTLEVRSVAIPIAPTAQCGELVDRVQRQACRRFNEPGGIVMNQRMRYRVRVEAARGDAPQVDPAAATLETVDFERLLVVDYRRQPFASGELRLVLDGAQAVETIGIESDPGELGALLSLGELSAARQDWIEAERKAREREERAR